LLDLGPREITVTMGSEGALWLNRNEQRHQKALPIEAVDTNGAGDVFAGASMHARYQGWPPEHRLKFASACSALKCQQWGNREALPKMEPILSLLG
jgi:sugar/nucleoside kinase (ribokinase family)